MNSDEERIGHGWWPYLGPYIAFLLSAELTNSFPDSWDPALLVIKPAIPLGLILYFAARGRYATEWASVRFRPVWALLDVAVGLVLTLVWMAPYLYIAALPRPDPAEGFDVNMAGESMAFAILLLRMFGYAIVTPIFEEIFIRSFVLRYSDCYLRPGDFRDIPLARYSLRSFVATCIIFTMGHAPWEYWVCLPWVALSTAWFYLRKDMGSAVLVHATTNASILIYVYLKTGGVSGLPLWVFV
jgi:CAAX prenyl protease-like protein